ncbi:hypothetical protein VB005_02464 [Metarhizium brunneum]
MLSTSHMTSKTTHGMLNRTVPGLFSHTGASDEFTPSYSYAVPPRPSDRPGNTADGYIPIPEVLNSSLTTSPVTRAASNLAVLQSSITKYTFNKLVVGTTTISSTVAAPPRSTFSGPSTSLSRPNLRPDVILSPIAGLSETETSIPPTDGERPESVSPTDGSTPNDGKKQAQDSKEKSQDQQASAIGIATGAVSASVMFGIIVYLITRRYKSKRAYRLQGTDIFASGSQKSFDSGRSNTRPTITKWQRQDYHRTINNMGSSSDNYQVRPRQWTISRPFPGGNSLGL